MYDGKSIKVGHFKNKLCPCQLLDHTQLNLTGLTFIIYLCESALSVLLNRKSSLRKTYFVNMSSQLGCIGFYFSV